MKTALATILVARAVFEKSSIYAFFFFGKEENTFVIFVNITAINKLMIKLRPKNIKYLATIPRLG